MDKWQHSYMFTNKINAAIEALKERGEIGEQVFYWTHGIPVKVLNGMVKLGLIEKVETNPGAYSGNKITYILKGQD